VHDCGTQYQVLFNLTTVHYFHKRFPTTSAVKKVTYLQESRAATLSRSLKVSVYKLTFLSAEEKLAIKTGRQVQVLRFFCNLLSITGLNSAPNKHVHVDSEKTSVPHAQLTASPMHPFAGLSWDGGGEVHYLACQSMTILMSFNQL
jgi:hypothetical protein